MVSQKAAASGLLCVSAVLAALIVMPREESVQLGASGTDSGASKADRLNPLYPDASANAGLNPALARALATVKGPPAKANAGAQTDSLYQHEKLAQVQQVIALEKRIQHQFSQLQVPSQKTMSVLGNGGSAPRQGQLEEIPDIVKSLKNPLAHCADRAGNTLRTDMCNDDMIDMGTLPGHHAGASGEMPEIEETPAMVNFHENEQETNSIMHGPSNVLGGRAQTISSPIHRGSRAPSPEQPPPVFIPPPSPPPPPPVVAEAAAVAKGGTSSPLFLRPEIRPGPLNCDDIADLDLWFECENNKRLAVGQDVATAPPSPPPPPPPPPQVPQAPQEDCDAILDIDLWFDCEDRKRKRKRRGMSMAGLETRGSSVTGRSKSSVLAARATRVQRAISLERLQQRERDFVLDSIFGLSSTEDEESKSVGPHWPRQAPMAQTVQSRRMQVLQGELRRAALHNAQLKKQLAEVRGKMAATAATAVSAKEEQGRAREAASGVTGLARAQDGKPVHSLAVVLGSSPRFISLGARLQRPANAGAKAVVLGSSHQVSSGRAPLAANGSSHDTGAAAKPAAAKDEDGAAVRRAALVRVRKAVHKIARQLEADVLHDAAHLISDTLRV